MTRNVEEVTIDLDGVTWSLFKDVTVNAAINEAARSFSVTASERPLEWIAPPGTKVQIKANGDLVVDGYVNQYKPATAATNHKVVFTGRGKGQDLIDCSAVHDPGYAEMKTPVDFARALDHFGIGITDDIGLDTVDYQQIYQGERAFKTLERYIRPQGAVAMGEPDGSIRVTNASKAGRHSAPGLIEGWNMKVSDAVISDQHRHSDITVKGQRRHGFEESDLRIAESSQDPGVTRYRPKIIINETDTTKALARKRADHEANRSQGFSVKANITTQGWRDDGGMLWSPNMLVYVESPILKIKGDMLIEKVTFTQDNPGGSLTKMSLVNAKAYGGDGGPSQSDKAWG